MKKLLSILLVAIMLLTPLALSVSAESVTDSLIEATPLENKITNELSAHLEEIDDNEYVKIYVWLNDYGEDMLYEALSKRLGTVITATTEESYIANKISLKKQFLKEGLERLAKTGEYNTLSTMGKIEAQSLSTAEFRAQALIPEVMSDTEIKACLESQMTSDEIISLSERTQFLKDYRATRKALNTSVNDTFYKKLNLSKCKNVYLDQALAYAELECTKSYIDNLEDMDIVEQIGLYRTSLVSSNSIETDNSSARGVSGNNYEMTPHQTLGYDGTGIKVGVVEVATGTGVFYDATNPHLSAKSNAGKLYSNYDYCGVNLSERTVSQHATAVLSILCGDPVTVNEKTYQGIAPNATVYYYCVQKRNNFQLYRALGKLVFENEVSVINLSCGDSTQLYTSLDAYLDCFIQEYRTTVVIAAGNNQGLETPAWAFNAITVGNVSNEIDNLGKYIMETDSAYSSYNDFGTTNPSVMEEISAQNMPNKPDLSAFGTNIIMASNNGVINHGTGTSFATPMVTGTVALMMQANSNLTGKPDLVKSILAISADEDAISEYNNPIISSTPSELSSKIDVTATLRKISGAGLLDIDSAIRLSNSNDWYRWVISRELQGEAFFSAEYNLYAGTQLEISMVFEKSTHDVGNPSFVTQKHGTNLEIQLVDSIGNVVASSTGNKDNVEVLECLIKTTGLYRLKLSIVSVQQYTYAYPSDHDFYDQYGNEIEHAEHLDNTFVSVMLSCNCNNKNLQESDYIVEGHFLSCNNPDCQFGCVVRHNISTKTKSYNNYRVAYSVGYLFANDQTLSIPISDFRYFGLTVNCTPPRNTIIVHDVMVSYVSTQRTAWGEIRTITYEAIIEENSVIDFVNVGSITITIDHMSRTITLS